MNILVVESKNDKAFVEALVQHLNNDSVQINAHVDTPICMIDAFECLDGLDEMKLKIKIQDIASEITKPGKIIRRIGILIDQDNKSKQARIEMVNTAIKSALYETKGLTDLPSIEDVGSFINIRIDEYTEVGIACFFTNVDGQGELETILKNISNKDATYANCLEKWRECLITNGKKISPKEFDKFWISNYIRFDTCSPKDRKRAEQKCSMRNLDYVLQNKKDVFDYNSELLVELRNFLLLFK